MTTVRALAPGAQFTLRRPPLMSWARKPITGVLTVVEHRVNACTIVADSNGRHIPVFSGIRLR